MMTIMVIFSRGPNTYGTCMRKRIYRESRVVRMSADVIAERRKGKEGGLEPEISGGISAPGDCDPPSQILG